VLIRYAARHLQHIHKALELMNVKFSLVVTDIIGATGRAILKAILLGVRDPLKLAKLRDRRCKSSRPLIILSFGSSSGTVGSSATDRLNVERRRSAARLREQHVMEGLYAPPIRCKAGFALT
jgi:hypothetical protein